jgi:hypothetical protein
MPVKALLDHRLCRTIKLFSQYISTVHWIKIRSNVYFFFKLFLSSYIDTAYTNNHKAVVDSEQVSFLPAIYPVV